MVIEVGKYFKKEFKWKLGNCATQSGGGWGSGQTCEFPPPLV